MFASMTLLLLLGNYAAVQADPAGALCTVDPEASPATDPAGRLHSSLNLLQVHLSMQSEDNAPEGEGIEYTKLGLKATADVNSKVLGLLSEDMKDLDQLLPREESLLSAVSLLESTDSILTAASAEKLTISTPPPLTVDQDPPQGGTMIYAVVGVILLVACCFPLWGCLRVKSEVEASDVVGKFPVTRMPSTHSVYSSEAPSETSEVWERKKGRKRTNKLIQLFNELAERQLSDESPPGFFNRGDLAGAMADPRIKKEMVRLGLEMNDCDTVFPLLGGDSVGLVDMRDFMTGALDMGARQH